MKNKFKTIMNLISDQLELNYLITYTCTGISIIIFDFLNVSKKVVPTILWQKCPSDLDLFIKYDKII